MGSERGDAELVAAARGGDRDALAALLGRHGALLRALCLRALGDPGAAEDAAQEAMLQAMLNLDRLRRPDRFGAWLAGIGLNVCRRLLRARGSDPWSWEALHGGVRRPDPIDSRPGPEAAAAEAELAARVRGAVATLPRGQRAAVGLFYLEGLTQAEAASELGIGVGAVKTRLHKAREALRRELRQTWEEETVDGRLDRRTLAKGAGALAGMAAGMTARGAEAEGRAVAEGRAGLVEMRVTDVRRHAPKADGLAHHAVLLEEVDGPRRLAVWVGEFEGVALAAHLEGIAAPRPLTYALAAEAIRAAGGRVTEGRIVRLVGDVFYGETVVVGAEGERALDARPSDALNLALLFGAPVRVDPAVIEVARSNWDALWGVLMGEGTEGAAAVAATLTAGMAGPAHVSKSDGPA